MNKRCIVNVATGDFYCSKQSNLLESMWEDKSMLALKTKAGFGIYKDGIIKGDFDVLLWTDILPERSSPHSESPYGFKVHAIQKAYELGYRQILWLDSPAEAVKEDISPIFDKIEHEGYYAMSHHDPLDNWIGERVLNLMKIPRERLKGLHLPSGSCYGFDLDNLHTKVIFERFYRLEQAGYFQSEHLYMGGEVIGWHRHDEAILALLLLEAGKPVFYYDPLFQSDDERCVIKSGDGAKNF